MILFNVNRMYLNTYDYNRCRLMTALETLLKEIGGHVRADKETVISNRDVDPDKTIKVTQGGSIEFEYNGVVYTYMTDDNPFFDFYFMKRPLLGDKYTEDVYCENDTVRVYGTDSLYFRKDLSDREMAEKAKLLLEFLVAAPMSRHYYTTHKARVANLYDGGFHFESVRDKERYKEIWWEK